MRNYDYYDEYNNDYYDDNYYDDYSDIYTKKEKISKSNKKKFKNEDGLFTSRTGKKKKKDYKKFQKEKEKMKLEAVNSLIYDDEDEE